MTDAASKTAKVLVTGANGFIGSASVRALVRSGCTVMGTYWGDARPDGPHGVTWVRVDLTDPGAITALMEEHRPSHLLALAWYMGPGNLQALENFRWLQHSIDLLIAFAEAGGARVTFCGSCMEYDQTQPVRLHETETPLRPATAYGAAKAALFAAFEPLCGILGLSGSWARPFFLYGPGEKPTRLAADVIVSLLEGREALCTHGRQKRDFLHVDDVGDALARLLMSDVEGPLNIGSGEAIAVAELVHEIGRQTGATNLIRLGAREARPNDPPLVEANIGWLRDKLDWQPNFTLETGVANTIAWWRREMGKDK